MSELVKADGYYPHLKTVPSGRYRIYAYSPYRYTELVRVWQDTRGSKLERRFDEIIGEMEVMARQIPSLIVEGEKRETEERARREAEHRETMQKMALEARQECESESRADLKRLIASWASLKDQEAFLDELIRALDEVEPGIREELSSRLDSAKALLGTTSVVDLIREWKTPKERFASLAPYKRGEEEYY